MVVANKRSFHIFRIDLPNDCGETSVSAKKRGVFSLRGGKSPKGACDGSTSDWPMRKILDAPGGTGALLIIPGSQSSPGKKRLIASSQSRGILYGIHALTTFLVLPSLQLLNPLEERITWTTAPIVLKSTSAFIVGLLGNTLEVRSVITAVSKRERCFLRFILYPRLRLFRRFRWKEVLLQLHSVVEFVMS